MKSYDIRRLVVYEYQFKKTEWIISCSLQCVLYTLVFFLLSFSLEIDDMVGKYLQTEENGYEFELKGFTDNDTEWLEKNGFYQIDLKMKKAVTDSLKFIWLKKISAVIKGKDLWNSSLDEIIEMILFFKIIFISICFVLIAVMQNNLSNSVIFRLEQRRKYLKMIYMLGLDVKNCRKIYFLFFRIRNVTAIIAAYFINVSGGYIINTQFTKHLNVSYKFSNGILMALILVTVSEYFMQKSFNMVEKSLL